MNAPIGFVKIKSILTQRRKDTEIKKKSKGLISFS
jgi:hypothetical protein